MNNDILPPSADARAEVIRARDAEIAALKDELHTLKAQAAKLRVEGRDRIRVLDTRIAEQDALLAGYAQDEPPIVRGALDAQADACPGCNESVLRGADCVLCKAYSCRCGRHYGAFTDGDCRLYNESPVLLAEIATLKARIAEQDTLLGTIRWILRQNTK